MKLSQEPWQKTAVFMQTQARPLARALFAFEFGNGTEADVTTALAAFQNDDGGFGHGLEPDVQLADSSVLATTVALQHMRRLGLLADHPLVERGMNYLHQIYSPEHQSWPFVPSTVDAAPHAPWWVYEPDFKANWHNPRPEIVGYLLDWGDKQLAAALLTAVLTLAATQDEIEMHALFCYQRLLQTRALPQDARDHLLPLVEKWAVQHVETNPEKWGGYGLRPLAVAPTPDSPLAARFADAIDQELAYIIQTQQDDGAWWPTWSWGDSYSDVWPRAKEMWKGQLTLQTLRQLRAYGRLADVVG
ncbi:MAG: hypothetical protein GY943_02685 [Chloroflexi bacterium]|nr:hypothetical protein [Chloroflexota bacterium]